MNEMDKNTNVSVNVDVTKIVKYSCVTASVIVAIIFLPKVVLEYFKSKK